jgi:hypothetical protein
MTLFIQFSPDSSRESVENFLHIACLNKRVAREQNHEVDLQEIKAIQLVILLRLTILKKKLN